MANSFIDISEESYYMDPSEIIRIFMKRIEVNMSYEDLLAYIDSIKVTVTEEMIESYLDKTFETEESATRKRMKDKKGFYKDLDEWTEDEIYDNYGLFLDLAIAERYKYEPNTLKYFEKYNEIIRKKIIDILKFANSLVQLKNGTLENVEQVKKQLIDLDIKINEEGLIFSEDFNRISMTLFDSFLVLCEKTKEANDLKTYKLMSITDKKKLHDNIDDEELYPSTSLLIDRLDEEYIKKKK